MTFSTDLYRRAALKLAAALAVGASLSLAAHAQTAMPDEFIKKLSTEVVDQIRNDKAIQAGDTRRINDFVDTTLMPQVNFERMTSLSVGRSWRSATPEQQKFWEAALQRVAQSPEWIALVQKSGNKAIFRGREDSQKYFEAEWKATTELATELGLAAK